MSKIYHGGSVFLLLNPDYALGFVMRTVSAIKSGCLDTESAAADIVNLPSGIGRVENSNVVTDFEAITGRNRIANAYYGLKQRILGMWYNFG